MINILSVLSLISIFSVAINVEAQKLNESSQNLLRLEQQISMLYTKVAENKMKLSNITLKVNELNQTIATHKKILFPRLIGKKKLAYGLDFQLIFDKNTTQALLYYKILKNLNDSDASLLYELHLQKNELLQQEQQLKTANGINEKLLEQLVEKEKNLIAFEKAVKKEITAENNVNHLLQFKGQLSLPLKINPAKTFGVISDSKNNYVLSVKGLVYQPKASEPVVAFGLGKVIFSDPISYWGQSLIIKHEGDYYTLYAGLQKKLVNFGDVVQQGQMVALASGSDFYFELRHNEIQLNPLKWVGNNENE